MADEINIEDKKEKSFFHGPNGKSSNRLLAITVTYAIMIMILVVQGFRIYQDYKSGNAINLIEINMSVAMILLAGYVPKLAETIAGILKDKLSK